MSWPAMVLWALIIPVLFSRGPLLLYMLSIVAGLQSLQMLPGGASGVNLLPITVYAGVLVCKVAIGPGNLMRALGAALDPGRLGLFTAFAIYSMLTAFALPRMFGGLIEIIPVSGADLFGTAWLSPRSSNITQTCYLMISYLTALAFAVIGTRPTVRRHFLLALLAGGAALILTGLLDLVCNRLGLGGLLDPFRTASYALLTDAEAAGAHRVVGLTPEASSYGTLCISAAAAILFLRPLYRSRMARVAAVSTLLGLAALAALSTSATAYVGGAVLACIYLFDLTRRVLDRGAVGRDILGWEIGALMSVGFIGLGIVALMPERVAPIFEVLDKVIFQKSASLSYYQRTMWTRVGWQAFLDSGGLGVGLGSVRTSNWAVSILASTGFFGGFLIFGYFFQKVTLSTAMSSREEAAFLRALKLTIFPYLAMSFLGGTIPDIGIGTAATLGFLSGERTARPRRKPEDEIISLSASSAKAPAGPPMLAR